MMPFSSPWLSVWVDTRSLGRLGSHATAAAAHDENVRDVAVVAHETRSSHARTAGVDGCVGGVGGAGGVTVPVDTTVHTFDAESTASFTDFSFVVSVGMWRTFALFASVVDGTTTNSVSAVLPYM